MNNAIQLRNSIDHIIKLAEEGAKGELKPEKSAEITSKIRDHLKNIEQIIAKLKIEIQSYTDFGYTLTPYEKTSERELMDTVLCNLTKLYALNMIEFLLQTVRKPGDPGFKIVDNEIIVSCKAMKKYSLILEGRSFIKLNLVSTDSPTKPDQAPELMQNETKAFDRQISQIMTHIPLELSSKLQIYFAEFQKAFTHGLYTTCMMYAGIILESGLIYKYYELEKVDASSGELGIGLGKLIGYFEKQNLLDSTMKSQVYLINEHRINSVHAKRKVFVPSREEVIGVYAFLANLLRKFFVGPVNPPKYKKIF